MCVLSSPPPPVLVSHTADAEPAAAVDKGGHSSSGNPWPHDAPDTDADVSTRQTPTLVHVPPRARPYTSLHTRDDCMFAAQIHKFTITQATHTCTRARTHTCMPKDARTPPDARGPVHTHRRTHIHRRTHTHRRTQTHTCTHAWAHIYSRAREHIHNIYIHKHSGAHTHKYSAAHTNVYTLCV